MKRKYRRVYTVLGVIALCLVILISIAYAATKAWQNYDAWSESLVADGDDLLGRNVSVTPPADGTIERLSWGALREQIRTDVPKCFAINAASASDDLLVWKNTTGETVNIQNIYGVLLTGTNVIGGLDECDSDGASCSAIDSDITFDGSEDTDDGSLTNADVDNNDWIRWHTTSVSAPGYLSVCFTLK